MEVRHILEERDELARKIAKELGVIKAGDTVPVIDPVIFSGAPYLSNPKALQEGYRGALTLVAHYLPSADVVLWKGNLLDVAVHNYGIHGGEIVPQSILPHSVQYWILDHDAGQSVGWRAIQDHHARGEQKKLVAIVTGLSIGFAGWGEPIDGLCPVFYVLREKRGHGNKDSYTFSMCLLEAGKPVRKKEPDLMAFALMKFMHEQFVTRDLLGVDRRGKGKFRFEKPTHRFTVERLVLREQVIVPIGNAPESTETDEEKAQREHDCCWLVRPHVRRYAKPIASGEYVGQYTRPIRSHVKGDKTKPMLPPRDRVIQVCR